MRIAALIATALVLSACASKPVPPPVIQVNTRPPVVAQKPDPITPQPVEWKVYNASGLHDLVNESETSGKKIVLFTLDEANFKALLKNLSDVSGFVKQQNAVIDNVVKAANVDQPPKEKK